MSIRAMMAAFMSMTDPGFIPGLKRDIGHGKSLSYTKSGPGRQHRSGRVRPSLSRLPEFGVDARGNVIPEQPDKYLHSMARGFRGLRRAMEQRP